MHSVLANSSTVRADMSALIGVNDLASVLLQCFSLILVGYLSGRFGLIKEKEWKGLSAFVTYFSLPALIFKSLSTSDLSHINWYFVLSILVSKALVFTAVAIITAILTKPLNLGNAGLFAIFSTQSNDFALGYPLLASLYGKSNPEFARYLYVLAPIQLVVLNPIGLFLMESDKQYRQTTQLNGYLKIFVKVLKQIIKNPIIFMTVFGVIWNISFNNTIPQFMSPLLQVLSDSFSATALFLLGLNLVGKFKIFTTSSQILLVPLVLVMTKILILPLLNRIIIQTLMSETNTQNNQTLELSNFGFLYGTIPSAPTVFIFALQYDSPISTTIVSTGMVMSTVLSAPLMFVSANMIRLSANILPDTAFRNDLGQTMSYSGLLSVFCIVWTLIVLFCGHKWRSLTHRCTIALALSQLMIGMGGYLWPYMDSSTTFKRHYLIDYLQYILSVGGILSSRIWTAMLSITLSLLHWKNLCFVMKIHKRLSYFAAFLTLILLLFVIYVPNNPSADVIDPNFEFGSTQAYISIIILISSLIVTLFGLITQQHFRSRMSYNQSSSVNSEDPDLDYQTERLIANESEHSIYSSNTNRRGGRVRTFSNQTIGSNNEAMVEVEDILGSVLSSKDLCPQSSNCSESRRKSCLTHIRRYREHMDVANEMTPLIQSEPIMDRFIADYHQISQHIFLLLTLLLSMSIGLTVSIGKLVVERPTGIFVELEFLDILLNYGQGVITFLIFGLEMTPLLDKITNLFCIQSNPNSNNLCIVLPPLESLSPITKEICDNFITCHKQNCIKFIVFEHQINQNSCHVFRGKDLIDFLIRFEISSDRTEAENYGKHLIYGRIIRHITNSQDFYDKTFLYKFIDE